MSKRSIVEYDCDVCEAKDIAPWNFAAIPVTDSKRVEFVIQKRDLLGNYVEEAHLCETCIKKITGENNG